MTASAAIPTPTVVARIAAAAAVRRLTEFLMKYLPSCSWPSPHGVGPAIPHRQGRIFFPVTPTVNGAIQNSNTSRMALTVLVFRRYLRGRRVVGRPAYPLEVWDLAPSRPRKAPS